MKIGIIGSGHIGGALARHFIAAGHEVAISNSRGPASLESLAQSLGPRASAMTVDQAVRFGEVVALAAPWRSPEALPSAELVRGKIVIDAMNPYSAEGEVMDLGDVTSSEETQRRLPGARLVKAFNTMYYHTLATEARPPGPGRLVLFVAGDDPDAKRVVSGLIEEIGFSAVDTGSLREGGRKQQPGSPLYNHPMTVEEAGDRLREMGQGST
jgi:8-hydroxy-5-deazaflavin:NADPH oxidoreductase